MHKCILPFKYTRYTSLESQVPYVSLARVSAVHHEAAASLCVVTNNRDQTHTGRVCRYLAAEYNCHAQSSSIARLNITVHEGIA